MGPNDVYLPSKKNRCPNGDVTDGFLTGAWDDKHAEATFWNEHKYPLIPQIRGKPWTSESWTLHFPHWFSTSVYPRECYPTLSKSQPYLFMTQPVLSSGTSSRAAIRTTWCHSKMMGLPKTVLVSSTEMDILELPNMVFSWIQQVSWPTWWIERLEISTLRLLYESSKLRILGDNLGSISPKQPHIFDANPTAGGSPLRILSNHLRPRQVMFPVEMSVWYCLRKKIWGFP